MTYVERGGIVGIYSSGVNMTLKVWFTPMETTLKFEVDHFQLSHQNIKFKHVVGISYCQSY